MALVSDDAHISIQTYQMVALVQKLKRANEQQSHGLLWNCALLVNWINVWILKPDTDAKPTISTLIHLMHTKMNCKTQEVLQPSDFPTILHLLCVRYVNSSQTCPPFFKFHIVYFSSELGFKNGVSDIFRNVMARKIMVSTPNVFVE